MKFLGKGKSKKAVDKKQKALITKRAKAKDNTAVNFDQIKKKDKKRLAKKRVVFLCIFAFLFIALIVALNVVVFKVSSVSVAGNGAIESEEAVLQVANIKKGVNLFSVNGAKIETAIKNKFTSVKSVTIKRSLPDKIIIELDCDQPIYFTEIDSEYFALSKDFRVLGRYFDKNAIKQDYPGIKKIKGGKIKRAIVGEYIEYADEKSSDFANKIMAVVSKSDIFDKITSIDYSNRFNVYVVYESRIKANIGSIKDADLKLKFMKEIINDLGQAKGSIDIKDVKTGYVLLRESGELD